MNGASVARSASVAARRHVHDPHAPRRGARAPRSPPPSGRRRARPRDRRWWRRCSSSIGTKNDDSVGRPRRAAEQHAVLAVGGDEERRVRPLHGPRPHVQPLGGVEAALEVERLAAPALLHQRDAFLDARAASLAVGLERLVVLQRAAAADADVEPPAAHHVEHGELLGQVHRMVQGQQAHAHAEPQRASCGRRRTRRAPAAPGRGRSR